jgi:surfactin synthase thioesterase subunit
LGGKPSIFLNNARWRRHYLPTIRADLQLSDVYTYRDERPLECPLHAFVGEADDLMHREDWEAWSEQAGADFSRCLLPGGHIFDRNTQALLITRIAGILTATLTRGVPGASRCVPTRSADGIAVAQAGA